MADALSREYTAHVDKVARAIARAMLEQNVMLEMVEGDIALYDSYDNKFYDCRALARAAMEAIDA